MLTSGEALGITQRLGDVGARGHGARDEDPLALSSTHRALAMDDAVLAAVLLPCCIVVMDVMGHRSLDAKHGAERLDDLHRHALAVLLSPLKNRVHVVEVFSAFL